MTLETHSTLLRSDGRHWCGALVGCLGCLGWLVGWFFHIFLNSERLRGTRNHLLSFRIESAERCPSEGAFVFKRVRRGKWIASKSLMELKSCLAKGSFLGRGQGFLSLVIGCQVGLLGLKITNLQCRFTQGTKKAMKQDLDF